MSLTVCLLTRNDADKIVRAIRSVADVAREIIVADTGSTDGTVAAATNLGARVEAVAWDDDFAAARNQALASARGDWVLWLNPDEELDAASRAPLVECFNHPRILAWYLRILSFARPEGQAFSETLQLRLFRNGQGARFLGRLHPHFEVPMEELARQRHMTVAAADVRIRHHAYLSTLTEDKLRWTVRLLEKELRDRPGQLHYQIEYGLALTQLNDPIGQDVLRDAATQVLAMAEAPTAPTATVGSLLEHYLLSPASANPAVPLEQAKELARRWFPTTPPVLWALSLTEFRDGRYGDAIPLLERLIQLGQTGQYDRAFPFEPSIIGGLAWQNLGLCHARLGDLDRAELCFGKLLTLPGFQNKGREQYAWVQQQRQAAAPTAP